MGGRGWKVLLKSRSLRSLTLQSRANCIRRALEYQVLQLIPDSGESGYIAAASTLQRWPPLHRLAAALPV
jgi:hypothetical protein